MTSISREKLLQALFDTVPLSVAIADREGRFLEVNRAFLETLGYTREEASLQTFVDITHPDDRPETLRLSQRVRNGASNSYHQEKRCVTRKGDCIRMMVRTTVLRDAAGAIDCWLELMQEVADRPSIEKERQRLASQMQHAQRMEAIGSLTGGMAHDFNNLLMGIQGNISLLLLNKSPGDRDVAYLKSMEASVLRAAELTRQILDFARSEKCEVKAVDLNRLLEETSAMFGRSKKNLTIRWNLQKDLWTVAANREQIRLALLNLLINAWQAMPGSGELLLETANVSVDAKDALKPLNIVPGAYVLTRVTDTGIGMSPEVQARIFEPFFTTREIGQAAGLGLYSAIEIIQKHGGSITVRSEEGKGSTFSIYLPASQSSEPQSADMRKVAPSGAKTILLVEDEEMVADIGRQMLERLGYHVLLARSGQEALFLYAKHHHAIDLVILDMIMPGMGGGDVFDRLKAVNPKVAVLLSSGYSPNDRTLEIINRGCRGFIQKPFSIEKLSHKIGEILSGAI